MQGRGRGPAPEFGPAPPRAAMDTATQSAIKSPRCGPPRVMSMHIREPVVQPVAVKSLRPTQIIVGMREVDEKRKRWREHKGKKKAAFLGRHMIPVIRGPKDFL